MEDNQFPPQNQGNADVPNHNDGAQTPNPSGSNSYNGAANGTMNAGFAPNPKEWECLPLLQRRKSGFIGSSPLW